MTALDIERELIEALKPFAEAYAPIAAHDDPNEEPRMRAFLDRNVITPMVTIGDFRCAYETVEAAKRTVKDKTANTIDTENYSAYELQRAKDTTEAFGFQTGDFPALIAFERYRTDQTKIPGMRILNAMPCFVAGFHAGTRAIRADASGGDACSLCNGQGKLEPGETSYGMICPHCDGSKIEPASGTVGAAHVSGQGGEESP